MYTYSKTFIGIPLSQFDRDIKPKESNSIILELQDLAQGDLCLDNIEIFLKEANEELNPVLKKLIEFRDGINYTEFKDLKEKFKLDFYCDYHGSDDQPVIFGMYIEELFSIPVSLGRLNIDLKAINQLNDRMVRFCYLIFGDELFSKLRNDNLIGTFINNHSS